MKTKNLKNKIFAAVVTSVIVLSGTICALAATPTPQPATTRPRPNSSTAATETTSVSSSAEEDTSQTASEDNGQSSSTVVTTAAPTSAPKTTAEKKYTTKGGAFGWFLLSVIVNSILSFAIGNRFYKMSKKDTHITSEIRALRRDVEEKFVANVEGFSEPEADIANSNDDYSIDADGIKANISSSGETEESAEEIFRRWESQLAVQRAEKRAEIRASVKPRSEQTTKSFVEDRDNEDKDVHFARNKSYQPRREIQSEENINDEYDMEEDDDNSKIESIKNKAKELITEIFPFKED